MNHVSEWDEDDDGWPVVKCGCGWSFVAPDNETASDAWGEHMYSVGWDARLRQEQG